MKKRYIILSCLFLLTAIILCISLLFTESLEFEYAMVITYTSLFLFILSVLILVFEKCIQHRSEIKLRLKKVFISIIISLIVFTTLFTFCSFISCYDSYIPESLYVTDKEYIQSFFPTKNIEEIKDLNDLYYEGCLEYSNFPGSSSIKVNSSSHSLQYTMNYLKSLSPTLNLRSKFNEYYYMHSAPDCIFENYQKYTINGVEVKVYNNNYKMLAYINRFNEHLSILIDNYNEKISSQEELANLAYNQFQLAGNAVQLKKFRERPWYDILFYLKERHEPYEPIIY